MNELASYTVVVSSSPHKIAAAPNTIIVENTFDGAMHLRGLKIKRVVLHKLHKPDLHDKILESLEHITHWSLI